uniref:Copia protein n=1 Tax=Cajanus cajan TaxID=3821 RepID=A0A151SY11_CAJCA|nr:Copia protein [Cajanus cajan]
MVSQFMYSPSSRHFKAVDRIMRYLKGNLSTSGYCTFTGGNLAIWRSKKQSVVAGSSVEAEYRSMVQEICEVLWISKLLQELKIQNSIPARLYSDNQAAEKGKICVPYIPIKFQAVDILTKGVAKKHFDEMIGKLSKYNIFKPARGRVLKIYINFYYCK